MRYFWIFQLLAFATLATASDNRDSKLIHEVVGPCSSIVTRYMGLHEGQTATFTAHIGNLYHVMAVSKTERVFLALVPYVSLKAHTTALEVLTPFLARHGGLDFVAGAGELHHGRDGFDEGNHTSKTAWNLPPPTNRNSLRSFERQLRGLATDLIAPTFTIYDFGPTGKNHHLDPRLNDKMNYDSTLHRADSDMAALANIREVIRLIHSEQLSDDERKAKLDRQFAKLHRERSALARFFDLFHGENEPNLVVAGIQRELADLALPHRWTEERYLKFLDDVTAMYDVLQHPPVEVIELGNWIPEPKN